MLRKLQEEQKPWVKHNFGDRPSWMPLLGAMEELGELAHAHLKEAQGIRNHENHVEKAKDAIADIVIFLADYCSARGLDFESIVQETWDKVKQRDWKKNPDTAYVGLGETLNPTDL
jgi:NTP pyrophosphatase (non-canonical NTP hydrolase)